MATKGRTVDKDEKWERTELPLFDALAAIDRKDYDWWNTLTAEQQRRFVPYMLVQWASTLKNSGQLSQYYLRSTDYYANMHLFNEVVGGHPQLQWLMLCAASPGLGKQFHAWAGSPNPKVARLESKASQKDATEWAQSTAPRADSESQRELADAWLQHQHRGVYIAQQWSDLKLDDIEVLNTILSDEEIEQYRRDSGQ